MESTIWHFGASGVSKVPRSEWGNKRDGQHIIYEYDGEPVLADAYLNAGDLMYQKTNTIGTIIVITSDGVDMGQLLFYGSPP